MEYDAIGDMLTTLRKTRAHYQKYASGADFDHVYNSSCAGCQWVTQELRALNDRLDANEAKKIADSPK